jgi:hypothetical protein
VFRAIRELPDAVGASKQARDLVRDPLCWDADPLETVVLYNTQALVVVDRNGGRVTHAFVLRDGVARTVSGTFKSYQYRDRSGVECDGPVVQNTVWTPNHRYIGTDVDMLFQRRVGWPQNRPARIGVSGQSLVERTFPDNFNAYDCDVGSVAGGVVCSYPPGLLPNGAVSAEELRDLLVRDGEARRAGTDATVLWHPATPFRKTFTLTGTTLRVSYAGTRAGHLVDNEFCVDLFAGVHDGRLLTRRVDDGTVTIAMPGQGAVTLHDLSGCEVTAESALTTVDQAEAAGRVPEFLSLHRVLTDAVQVRATTDDFSYAIDLSGPSTTSDPP